MINRDDLTKRVIELASLDIDLDQAVSDWWYDRRETGGLRLTDHGNEIFMQCLDLDSWHYEINTTVLIPRNLLIMDRYLTCPYHLSRSRRTYTLTLFGSKEAVMANLYGDITRFLQSLTAQ